jgi:ubiquinone/menaquinone biosynthesis C-methylase UbiE
MVVNKVNCDFISQTTELAISQAPQIQSWPNQFRLRSCELRTFFDNYRLDGPRSILEIGCGNGFSSALLSHIAQRVVATDLPYNSRLSHSFGIENASYLLKRLKVNNCHLIACDGQALPFIDKIFDIVFSEYVLEHIPNRERMLIDIKRVLTPNGLCILILPSYLERLFSIPTFYIYLAKRLIHHLLRVLNKNNNFSFVKMQSTISKLSKKYSNFPLPPPHGHYFSWQEEFRAYLPRSWIDLFEQCGFKIEKSFSLMFIPWHLIEAISSNLAIRIYEMSIRFNRYICSRGLFRYIGYSLCFVLRKK